MISWWNSQIYLQGLVITPYKFISRYPQWNLTDREKTWRDFHLAALFPPCGVLYIPALSLIHDTHSVSNVDWSVRKNASFFKKIYIITLIPSTRSVFDVWNRDILCDVKPQGVCSVYPLTNILVLIFLAFLRELSHNKSTYFFSTDLHKLPNNIIL